MNQIYRVPAPDREITYPRQIVEQLQQTAKKWMMVRGQKPRLKETRTGTLKLGDFCKIMSFSYEAPANRGYIDAVLSIVNPAKTIKITGTFLDLSNETCLGELMPVQGSGSHCELNCSFTLDRPPENPESLAALVNAGWIDSEGETEISMLHENEEDTVGDITYEHLRPKKEAAPQRIGTSFLDRPPYDSASREVAFDTKPIILAFKRAPEAQTDLDYICGFGTIGDNHPNFGVPGRGILSMKGGTIVMEEPNSPRATCSIFRADEGGGGVEAEYKFDYPGTVFAEEGGALYYDMVTGWGERYNEPGDMKKVLFDYQLDITACFKTGTRLKRVTWTVTSRPKPNASNITSIPQLQIMWGCLAKGTLIDRPNRPPCPIEDIHINDIVSSRNGAHMRVTNVWRGEAENLVSLVIKQGPCLRLTENHPVLTPEGWRHAAGLTPGMAVLDRNGQAVELQDVSVVSYGKEIYNLDLVPVSGEDRLEDHVMVAEGLCVSDNRGQNELNCVSEDTCHG